MGNILAENLSGKAVMGSDGTEFGMLYNITMDLKSGKLEELVITPDEEFSPERTQYDLDEAGRMRVPVNRVQAVKDYIVVQH